MKEVLGTIIGIIGLSLIIITFIGGIIMTFMTDEQKDRLL